MEESVTGAHQEKRANADELVSEVEVPALSGD